MSIPSQNLERTPAASRPLTRSQKKRQAILAAATTAFLESGYGAATMDDIAGRARVSKQTIYHHFGSKESLFAAIVEERCESFLAPLAQLEMERGDPSGALRALGVAFLKRVLTPESLALHRLVVAESARFPELGLLSYESGPCRIVERLARFLKAHDGRHGFAFPEPELAAEQFFGALLGFLQLGAILRNDPARYATRIDGHVEYAVAVFLDGHRKP